VNFENIVPIIILLVYLVLVFFKRKKINPDKETPFSRDGNSSLPKIFSIFGNRVGSFISGIEERFRMEHEESRNQGLEPHNMGPQNMEPRDVGVRSFDCVEQSVELHPGVAPKKPDPVEESSYGRLGEAETRGRVQKKKFSNLPKSRRVIRNAIVWSEILGPPVALGREKRPWER